MENQPEQVDIKPEAATELPAPVYREALDEVIKEHFGASHKDCKVTIDAGSSKGDNYIGVVYRVTAEHPTEDSLSVIAKLPPQNAARRGQFRVRPCFLRESEFYDSIFPLFTKFQQEKGINVVKDGFYEVPKCFKSLTEDPHEGLFLEDLKVTGFDMFDRFKDTTVDHAKLVMKVLGKFHAISFALKDQRPEVLTPYKELQEVFWFKGDPIAEEGQEKWFDLLKKQTKDVLSDCNDEELVKAANKFMSPKFIDMLESCVLGKNAEPYAVICHGDCWNNNIMFREENGVPIECRLLDWQIMRYCTPVCDLMYYIFGCTTKELRDKHYSEFMDVYYESLSHFITRLGSDPTKVFPRNVFEDHLKRFGNFGLTMAIMVLPIFTSKPEDTMDLDAIAEKIQSAKDKGEEVNIDESSMSAPKASSDYAKRMLGVFQDMHRLGYI